MYQIKPRKNQFRTIIGLLQKEKRTEEKKLLTEFLFYKYGNLYIFSRIKRFKGEISNLYLNFRLRIYGSPEILRQIQEFLLNNYQVVGHLYKNCLQFGINAIKRLLEQVDLPFFNYLQEFQNYSNGFIGSNISDDELNIKNKEFQEAYFQKINLQYSSRANSSKFFSNISLKNTNSKGVEVKK